MAAPDPPAHTRVMAVPPLATDGFQAFTAEHAGLLALLLLGAVVLGRVALRQRADDPVRFRRRFALLIPVFTVPFQVLQLLPGDFTLGTSLPIQVCDLSWMVAVWALWTRDARAVALLYFWGLTLDVQAAVTPSLDQTFPDPRYFMFWGMHFLTFWATVYVVCLALAGRSHFAAEGPGHAALFVSAGVVTAVPLILFGASATRVPLVTIGLLQYLAPILQFGLGVLYFHERMSAGRWLGFGIVWIALAVFTWDALRQRRRALIAVAPAAGA